MAAENAVKKVTNSLKFRNLNGPCKRLSTHVDVYEPSEDDYRLVIANLMTYVFVSFRLPYLCPSKDYVYVHSLINLSKEFLRKSPA